MIYLIIVATVFAIDILSKKYIESKKKLNDSEEIIKDKVDIHYIHNKGAILSTFEDKPQIVNSGMFMALGSLLTIFFQVLLEKKHSIKKFGMALMVGGALGNVIERIRKGYVVDFINLKNINKLKNVVFNLADIFLLIGGFLVTVSEIFGAKKRDS